MQALSIAGGAGEGGHGAARGAPALGTPGSSRPSRERSVGNPVCFGSSRALDFLSAVLVTDRAGQRVPRAAAGAQLLGLGPLL